MNEVKKDIEIYLFYFGDHVIFAFFKDEELIAKTEILKNRLGEELVESFNRALSNLGEGVDLSNIEAIYFSSSKSTLNVSRLVTLFVKTIVYFSDIKLYVKQTSKEGEKMELILRDFINKYKKTEGIFRRILNPLELKPIYI